MCVYCTRRENSMTRERPLGRPFSTSLLSHGLSCLLDAGPGAVEVLLVKDKDEI